MTWTEKHIKNLHKQGRIRGYKIRKKEKPKYPVTASKRSEEKDWISWNLMYWANEHAVELREEYKFHPDRKWRFDWAIPVLKIAVEYEGIFSEKSRHTTINGYCGDIKKYNAAQACGWRVVRVTAKDYETLLTQLNSLIDGTN